MQNASEIETSEIEINRGRLTEEERHSHELRGKEHELRGKQHERRPKIERSWTDIVDEK